MKKLIPSLLLSLFSLMTPCLYQDLEAERKWEQWDIDNNARVIDSFWLSTPEEIQHRRILAEFIKNTISSNDTFLEIGCGSGLVYNSIVPSIIPNDSYMGIDVSLKMLELANVRFPNGHFHYDDLYGLSYGDNSFDVVAAFEVFGHIDEIVTPIKEMFRTSSKLTIFTVWTGKKSEMKHEIIGNSVFNHKIFSRDEITKTVSKALTNGEYSLETVGLTEQIDAYIITKKN